MTVADDNNTQDWAAVCDGEGRERAVRDGGESGVVMMAVAVEDGGSGQRRQRRTMIAAEDNGMQDWVADYNREGQEWVAREGEDSRVVMMAAAVEDDRMTAVDNDGYGGRQQWRRTKAADDDSTQD